MTAQALKQAALDHLAAENASACSLPLGEDAFVCVGTKEAIAGLVASEKSFDEWWSQHQTFGRIPPTPPVDKDQS